MGVMEKIKSMLGNLKQRKVIFLVLGLIYGLLTIFRDIAGLALNPAAIVSTLAVIVIYIFSEGKLDFKRVQKRLFTGNKWWEPQFLMTAFSAFLPLLSAMGINIPVETVNGLVAVAVGLLFKRQNQKLV